MKRLHMRRRFLLKKLAGLTCFDQLNSVFFSCRPIKSVPECLADQCSKGLVSATYPFVNLSQKILAFGLEYTLHQHAIEALLVQFPINQGVKPSLAHHPLGFRATI